MLDMTLAVDWVVKPQHTQKLRSCLPSPKILWHLMKENCVLKEIVIQMSHAMRKPVYAICEQQRRCLDSISLVSISEISRLYLASVAAQKGLCLTWSQTPKTGFLVTRLKYYGTNMVNHRIQYCFLFEELCLSEGLVWNNSYYGAESQITCILARIMQGNREKCKIFHFLAWRHVGNFPIHADRWKFLRESGSVINISVFEFGRHSCRRDIQSQFPHCKHVFSCDFLWTSLKLYRNC